MVHAKVIWYLFEDGSMGRRCLGGSRLMPSTSGSLESYPEIWRRGYAAHPKKRLQRNGSGNRRESYVCLETFTCIFTFTLVY